MSILRYFGGSGGTSGRKDPVELNNQAAKHKLAYDRSYESSKRQRHFMDTWSRGREWLVDSPNGMVCMRKLLILNKFRF